MYSPVLSTEAGNLSASLEVVLGHEMGHAVMGVSDANWIKPNGGRMMNVDLWENPLRQDLGLPLRIIY